MAKIRVAIRVTPGVTGFTDTSDLARLFKNLLNTESFEVEIFDSLVKAVGFLDDEHERRKVLVYLSISAKEEAETMAERNRHFRVFLFTSEETTAGEVIVVEKRWLVPNTSLVLANILAS